MYFDRDTLKRVPSTSFAYIWGLVTENGPRGGEGIVTTTQNAGQHEQTSYIVQNVHKMTNQT